MEILQLKSEPRAIFMSDDHYLSRCKEVVKKAAALGGKENIQIPESLLEELRCFPDAFKALVLYPPLQDALIQELYTMPGVAYDVIIADYTANSPYLETTLYSSPELVYRLLVWARESKTTLRYPVIFYSQLLLEDIIWAIRWNKILNNEQYQYLILDFVEENRFTEAGSACLYLQLNSKEEAGPYSQALSSHWKYALLGAILFENRGIDLQTLGQAALGEAQQAYHFLLHAPSVDRESAIQTLYTHPGWLAQFITDSKDKDRLEIAEAALHVRNQHPLWPDYRLWLEQFKKSL